MGPLLFLIIIASIVYILVIKPFILTPYKEGYSRRKNFNPTANNKKVKPENFKKKGDDFERFIIRKFNPDFFKFKEWRGDKYIEGYYPESNLNPDLEFEFHLNNFSTRFAIECKFRQNLHNGYADIGTEMQVERYKNFQKERNIPVYIALGLGGYADNPDELFLIPINHFETNLISPNDLSKFRKTVKGNFHYNMQHQGLF